MVVSEMANNTFKGEDIMERKQFTFYRSFFESIENLRTKKEKAEAYRIICDYALNGKEPEQSAITPMVAMLFEIVRPVLDTAHKRAQLAKKLSDQKQLQADILPPVEVQV
jgi:hypothetical protein